MWYFCLHFARTAKKLTAMKIEQAPEPPPKPLHLHVLSDLHLEFGLLYISKPSADVVILAGDIGVGIEGLKWIKHHFADRDVIYVPGNHEFYHENHPELIETLQFEAENYGICVMDDSAIELHGYTFLGSTLWSSFATAPDPAMAMRMAEARINDYRFIYNNAADRVLRPADTAKLHEESVAWLKDELRRHDPARTIVITHHGPSRRSEDPDYAGAALSPSFCSNLDSLIERSGVPLWIHGHTHYCVDYRIGATRVLSNQRG